MKISIRLLVVFTIGLSACSTPSVRKIASDDSDRFLWLEEIESERSLSWVKAQSEATQKVLMADVKYAQFESQIRAIVTAKDRLPSVGLADGWYYNFWQDGNNPKGIWRRTSEKEFSKREPKWELILDFDALSKEENESWVYKGASCLPPQYERCLLRLSRGGKDAIVVREFDVGTRSFVTDGFNHLLEAKTSVSWVDRDRVFIASNWGPGSLTTSGYPRIIKLWKRGEKAEQGRVIFEALASDMSAGAASVFRPEGNSYFVERRMSFYEREAFWYEPDSGKLIQIRVPNDSDTQRVFKGRLLLQLRSEWSTEDGRFPTGSLISFDSNGKCSPVYIPRSGESIAQVSATKDRIYLNILRNVSSRLFEYKLYHSPNGDRWRSREIKIPESSDLSITDEDAFSEHLMVSVESFVKPTTLSKVINGGLRDLKKMPERFNSKGVQVEQRFVASRDGVKIPYFLIRKKTSRSGPIPVLVYGYGGFEISETPFYLNSWGKVWIENGGAFALANIRGGGEFGPDWHKAAILKNKQKSYDDFIAIAESLVSDKITVPQKLGIMGGSNGGLLVSAVMGQRPDLFGGTVCQVPLTDMLRYHKLLAGASWMAEYGNPEDPEMFPYIRAYSPYQNVKEGVSYPSIFVHTSTKDDRVHPGHARKFAARLLEVGTPVLYFENTEGGHSAAADLEQRVKIKTLEMIYLSQKLGL